MKPARLTHVQLARRAARTAITELRMAIQLDTTRDAERTLLRHDLRDAVAVTDALTARMGERA